MSKGRRLPVEKIRWTKAEKVNAMVWATEWGLTIFCLASAFAGIVVTRTLPAYVFLPTALTAVLLAGLSLNLRGKLRTVFRTQKRAERETTGRYRIEQLYGDTLHFGDVDSTTSTLKGEDTHSLPRHSLKEFSRS